MVKVNSLQILIINSTVPLSPVVLQQLFCAFSSQYFVIISLSFLFVFIVLFLMLLSIGGLL